MSDRQRPQVIFQPEAGASLQRGIDQIADAIRPTLGPRPGLVAIARTDPRQAPELVDNGAVIARRIVQLADRDADMGAMLIRQAVWRVHERVGDGTATTAVLFQFVYNEALRYLAAGYNAMRLRHYLLEGLELIETRLAGMASPVEGRQRLTQVAESICYDPPLANTLGEIFDLLGEHGQLDLRMSRRRETEHEYVEGTYWGGGLLSREMITNRRQIRSDLQEAALLITDFDIQDAPGLAEVLTQTCQAGVRSLVIVARALSESAAALLLSASQGPEKFSAFAVKLPGVSGTEQKEAIQDLSLLTGGQPYLEATGDSLNSFRPERFGRARGVWANLEHFGIVGGKRDARLLRTHLADLRAAFDRATENADRVRIRQRIGRLLGGSATLRVGGATDVEVEARKETIERTAAALRGVLREGIVPGGGVALLNCRPALCQKAKRAEMLEARAAYQVLSRAMEAPVRALLANTGHEASPILAEIERAGPGYGFDLRRGALAEMAQAGLWDAAAVVKAAVSTAVAGAALALTTDVLVHRKRQTVSMEP